MKTQTTIKINEENTISILNWNNGTHEIAHLENGEISYKHMNDVITTTSTSWELEEEISEIASEILGDILSKIGYNVRLEADQQVIIDTFTYNIWIAVGISEKGKFEYTLSTIKDEQDEDGFDEYNDRNQVKRSTIKGLLNYLERFDR